jgi:26S proteasome regulatory subunit N12
MNQQTRAHSLINNYHQYTDDKQKSEILKQLKLLMLGFRTLPPSVEPMNKDEFLTARDILELEMERYLNQKDGKNFELSYFKIKQFYFDYKQALPRSDRMLYFVGLYLLHLLANNRTTEFCTELELLDIEDLGNNYVRVSRDLETCIQEGNYKHIYSIKASLNNLPHYSYYLEKFDDAIKFQIARSAEKSYESLSVNDAISLLMLRSKEELNIFIKNETESLENREIDWKVQGDRVFFIPINKDKTSIPSHAIIEDTVSMAIQMEKII